MNSRAAALAAMIAGCGLIIGATSVTFRLLGWSTRLGGQVLCPKCNTQLVAQRVCPKCQQEKASAQQGPVAAEDKKDVVKP